MIRRDPIGVVGSIARGLSGGNTIVITPSEQTPLTTLKLTKTMKSSLKAW